MTETIATRDGGSMDCYLARPASGSGPGIVLLQEIFGVNHSMRALADSYASEGFSVLVPDLYWRFEPGIELGYSEDERQKAFGYGGQFDTAKGALDAGDTLRHLRGASYCTGKVAYVGYCLGGKIAVLAGTGDPADCVISFYGVGLENNLAELAAITCPLQFHVGDNDGNVPAEAVEKIKGCLASKGNAEVFVYPNAGHAFANKDRANMYNAAAAEQGWKRALGKLRSALA